MVNETEQTEGTTMPSTPLERVQAAAQLVKDVRSDFYTGGDEFNPAVRSQVLDHMGKLAAESIEANKPAIS